LVRVQLPLVYPLGKLLFWVYTSTMKKRNLLFLMFIICYFSFAQDSTVMVEPGRPDSDTAFDFELLQNRSGGITILRYLGTEKTVVIPETIGGLPATIIGTRAFYRKDLSAVAIPETVTTIEPLAFAENQLQSVEIKGCVSIAYEAFAENQISTLILSDRLSSIGPRAFINNKLSSLTIPGRITNIGRDAFTGNPLSSITVAANRNLFISQGFEASFINYYVGMGRRAGVYSKDDRIWVLGLMLFFRKVKHPVPGIFRGIFQVLFAAFQVK